MPLVAGSHCSSDKVVEKLHRAPASQLVEVLDARLLGHCEAFWSLELTELVETCQP